MPTAAELPEFCDRLLQAADHARLRGRRRLDLQLLGEVPRHFYKFLHFRLALFALEEFPE